MFRLAALLLLALVGCSHASLPFIGPSALLGHQPLEQCPSQNDLDLARQSLTKKVSQIIHKNVMPILHRHSSSCGCNVAGSSWHRLAFLNMTSSQESCPSPWTLITSPIRACGRRSTTINGCDSVLYPSNGILYSRVCGRITGLQRGTPNAFNSSVHGVGIEGSYIDGVSLTRGQPGSREHVWSFANAYYEVPGYQHAHQYVCPCMDPDWPFVIPSFIGNNYFCATGNRGSDGRGTKYYANDVLWDGIGCSGSSTCCRVNQPPWFCATLPTISSEDLEVRICGDQSGTNENTYIINIEIYVK